MADADVARSPNPPDPDEAVDLDAVRRDAVLLDALARGEIPDLTWLTAVLAAFRDHARAGQWRGPGCSAP